MEIVDAIGKGPRGEAFILAPAGVLADGPALERAFRRAKKPFLLVKDGNGLGVYGADAHWLIPAGVDVFPWVSKHLAPLIAWVEASPRSIASPWITTSRRMPAAQTFRHTGDIGDAIACLPVLRQLGGGEMVIANHPKHQESPGYYLAIKGAKYEALRPLLAAQSYIAAVRYDESVEGITHDFADFRRHYAPTHSLAEAQARHLGVSDLDLSPWLVADPDPRSAGRVIVARSPRYQNPDFPWRSIAQSLRGLMLFVGFAEEHRDFQRTAGIPVEHMPITDFLDLARLIAGSRLFIGNQSSPCWVAMGLGHPLLQETAGPNPDSIVPRDNAVFFAGGQVDLGQFGF